MILSLTTLDIRLTPHKLLASLIGSETTSSIWEKCLFSILNGVNWFGLQDICVDESFIDWDFCEAVAAWDEMFWLFFGYI